MSPPGFWHACSVASTSSERVWLTVPELVEQLGLSPSRIRRLIEDRHLAAKRIDGVLKVPADFVRGAEPLPELRGTLLVLHDVGFADDEAVDWLVEEEPSLGVAPIDALLAGRKTEVRRVAQALA